MIDPKQVVEGQRIQRATNDCPHPKDKIIDRPDRSYCRACGEDVPKLMRDKATLMPGGRGLEIVMKTNRLLSEPKPMDWMGRTKPSVFPVFPSEGDA